MKNFIIIIILFLNSAIIGQISNNDKIEKLKNKIETIESEIQIRTDSLNIFKKEKKHLENQEYLEKFKQKDEDLSVFSIVRLQGKLRKTNSPMSETITMINAGDTIKLTDYSGSYWIVNKGQFFGYLSEVYVKETEEVKVFKEELKRQNEELRKKNEAEKAKLAKLAIEKQTSLELQEQKKYQQLIINTYGKEIGQKLLDGYYWIGMTDDMARVSLGKPRNINKSVGTWGVHEQWIYYNNMYLYFKNGKLDSYQNSR